MESSRFDAFARRLRAWGLNGLAASLLESAGPFAFVGAQALYFAGDTFAPFFGGDDVAALARLLEDPAQVRAWARQLSQEGDA